MHLNFKAFTTKLIHEAVAFEMSFGSGRHRSTMAVAGRWVCLGQH